MKTGVGAALLAAVVLVGPVAAAPGPGYHARLRVAGPTTLDWTFVLTNRSLTQPPDKWRLDSYSAKAQEYDLFVPPRRDPKKPLPVILFISPSKDAAGWRQLEVPCKTLGMMYIGVRNAGNDCPSPRRVRIVLDVLDDVRRQFPLDVDRTYIGGFSGGGRMACAVAFALPEHFGGVLPVCAGGFLRDETWLRQRAVERLSVAFLTGSGDFNEGEIARFRGPQLKAVGVRTQVWRRPGLGHSIPPAETMLVALKWLEAETAKRRALAEKYPASRALARGGDRQKEAAALLAEAKQRLKKKETLYSGLMQLKGCMERWPDLEAGKEAGKLLGEYDARTERPWDADDIAEQRRYLIAEARALDAYASGPLPGNYARMRPRMARGAVQLWRKIEADSPDSPAGREAKKRIPALEKLAGPDKEGNDR